MSCVCILTPLVIAAWPSFSAAVVAAATSLGYAAVSEQTEMRQNNRSTGTRVNLEIENSEIVTTQIGRDQKISVMRDGVKVTFARDARGRASLCVEGQGHSEAALRSMGEELSQRVVQKYVYQRLLDEMRAKQFHVVEEETNADHSIRLKVRRWDN